MTRGPQALLVDAHAHFHTCFTWKTFLESAAANFDNAGRVVAAGRQSFGCLIVVDGSGFDSCRALLREAGSVRSTGWVIQRGDDGRSLVLTGPAGRRLVIVAGRQVVTSERLEVLALGCSREFRDGRPIEEILHEVVDRGAVAVIPWGFGKWLGSRGRVVRRLLDDSRAAPFCLADNGGRPHVVPRPKLLAYAERRSVPVLAGSDPLPLRREVVRAGSYGFVLDAWEPTVRPADAITDRLRALRHSPATFGRLSSAAATIRSQLGIRWRIREAGGLAPEGAA